jgi:RHS repeat-associated protein
VLFGYDDGGERLWRAGTNGYTIWIGGIYEVNNGTVLCHVVAGGQLVATFQPLCGGPWSKAFGEERWYAVSTTLQSVMAWPFQQGRSPMTYFASSWAAILGVCLAGGRGIRLKRHERRRSLRFGSLWKQFVTVLAISAFLASGTGDVEAATYSPVFYYYHTDHLGSSNVLTDRSGNVAQHYEYSTFGQQSYVNNTSAFPVSNRYTGQIADDETGLYYYGGRYYDPQLGRFIQPDPTVPNAEDSQSLNRYSYCSNNPLNNTDPSGFDDANSDEGYTVWDSVGNFGYPPFFEPGSNGGVQIYTTPQYYVTLFAPTSSDNSIPGYVPPSTSFSFGNPDPNGGGPAVNFDNAGFSNIPQNTGNGWLNGLKTGLNIASLIPGPIGAVSNLLSAGVNLVQGNYSEALTGLAIAGATAVGIGVAVKAYQLIRDARAAGSVARFGRALSTDYRATFFAANPKLVGQVVVHHAVPQRTLTLFPTEVTPSEIHSLENLRGIPNEINPQLHLSQIAKEWNQFYRANPNATRAQLLQKATEIDAKYGSQFMPPIGGRL